MKIKLYTEQQIKMARDTVVENHTTYGDGKPLDPIQALDELLEMLATLEDDGYTVTEVEIV